jgi:hypothetical protein
VRRSYEHAVLGKPTFSARGVGLACGSSQTSRPSRRTSRARRRRRPRPLPGGPPTRSWTMRAKSTASPTRCSRTLRGPSRSRTPSVETARRGSLALGQVASNSAGALPGADDAQSLLDENDLSYGAMSAAYALGGGDDYGDAFEAGWQRPRARLRATCPRSSCGDAHDSKRAAQRNYRRAHSASTRR